MVVVGDDDFGGGDGHARGCRVRQIAAATSGAQRRSPMPEMASRARGVSSRSRAVPRSRRSSSSRTSWQALATLAWACLSVTRDSSAAMCWVRSSSTSWGMNSCSPCSARWAESNEAIGYAAHRRDDYNHRIAGPLRRGLLRRRGGCRRRRLPRCRRISLLGGRVSFSFYGTTFNFRTGTMIRRGRRTKRYVMLKLGESRYRVVEAGLAGGHRDEIP